MDIVIDGEKFKKKAVLGTGTYGSVFLVQPIDSETKNEIAIKIMKNPRNDGIKHLRELDIMRRLVHPNLMRADSFIIELGKLITVAILMEKADTDLHHLMLEGVSICQKLNILYQTTLGLDFLHKQNILHLDIKPLNILIFKIDDKINAKLTDFGLSLYIENTKTGEVKYPRELITITHRPPEILEVTNDEYIYNKAVDIWSLGIIFMEVFSGGYTLITEYSNKGVLDIIYKQFNEKIIEKTLTGFVTKDKDVIELISKMLSIDSSKRPTTLEILNNPIFSHLNERIEERIEGTVIDPVRHSPKSCHILFYYGFDHIIRLSKTLNLNLSTVFLAGDIYQRSVPYSTLEENQETDWPNVAVLATTSVYMAMKILEHVTVDIDYFVSSAGNIFKEKDILKFEKAIVKIFKGILYPSNLYTLSDSKEQLKLGFKLLRNCYLYSRIDMKDWKKMDKNEKSFNKNIKFNEFFPITEYGQIMTSRNRKVYIEKLYNDDIKFMNSIETNK